MIKKYCRIGVLALAVLLCTAFIFSNSLKDSEASHRDSDVIVELAEDVADKVAPENELDWHFIVRKSAHLFEFFVFGLFMMLLLFQIKGNRRTDFAYALITVTVIAMTDEFIQSFVGRSNRFADVIIDVIGAVVGLSLVLLFDFLIIRSREKKASVPGSDLNYECL